VRHHGIFGSVVAVFGEGTLVNHNALIPPTATNNRILQRPEVEPAAIGKADDGRRPRTRFEQGLKHFRQVAMDLMGSHVLRGKPRANFPLHQPLPYPGLSELGLTKSPAATKRFEAVSL
jgi:hypothetical protein